MNMLPKVTLAVLGVGLVPGAANAATMVIGGGFARSCYEAALRDRPNQQNLATCDRALLEEALTADDVVATHVNRGILRMRSNDLDGALADYDSAIALDPTEPEAYLNKGVLVLKSETSWREARALFDAALSRHTRKPELAYYGRAMSNEIGGDVKSAYFDYKRASELAPEWQDPVQELTRFRVVSSPGA